MSINEDYITSGCHLEALKCTETYKTPSFGHLKCLNHDKFLNYKNDSVKYTLCSSWEIWHGLSTCNTPSFRSHRLLYILRHPDGNQMLQNLTNFPDKSNFKKPGVHQWVPRVLAGDSKQICDFLSSIRAMHEQ